MAEQQPQGAQSTAVTETTSARFVAAVERQFAAEVGDSLAWTDFQKTLAQHLYLKCDAQFAALEVKRRNNDAPPITWKNIDMQKLALDAVHRVSLGLDALVPNHIHPIPYLNSRTGKYDVDLRVGYVGKDYCRRKLAVEEPLDVIYQLVHETDEFTPYLRSRSNEIEGYEFKITKPFDRGEVVGGFGYIIYRDPKQNRLIIVTQRDFKRAEAAAKSGDFWGKDKSREEMQFKTIVHRVTDKLPLDPRKVNAKSYAYVEAQEASEDIEREADEQANGRIIDIEAKPAGPEPDPTPAAAEPAGEPVPAGVGARNGAPAPAAQTTIGAPDF